MRPPAEVIIECHQFGELSRAPLFQLVGAGADRRGAVDILAHLGVVGRLHDRDGGPGCQRSGVDIVHIDLDRVLVGRLDRTDAGESANDRRAVVRVAVVVVGIDDIVGSQFGAVVEHDALVQLERVGEAVGRDIDRLRQHKLLLVEVVNRHQWIVDVDDHHPMHGRAGVGRTETGNFLMSDPGHGAALFRAAHSGCRGPAGASAGADSPLSPGAAGAHATSSAAEPLSAE